MIKIADLSFYFFISIISIYFYTRILPLKYTKKTTKLSIGGLIFLLHLILFIPSRWEIVFNTIQMLGEFLIIYIFTKGKAAEKLIAYVEMNIAIGIGIITADFILKLNILKSLVIYTESYYIQRIFFYLTVLVVTYIILAGIIMLKGKVRKFIHIQGMEILVCMTMEIMCFLYVTGMMMLETKDIRNISTIFVFLVFVMLIFIFVKISDYIREKEKIYMEYYVIENIMSSTEYIVNRLKEDTDYYKLQMDIINNGISEAYEAAEKEYISDNMFLNVLLENKKEKAKMAGADMEISFEADNETDIEARDYITIAANLLDNAIEAVSQNHIGNRNIAVCGFMGKNRFFLQVKNPYEKEPVISGGEFETTKESKDGHGLGLKSVRRIGEKYGMSMKVSVAGGMFCVTIEGSS